MADEAPNGWEVLGELDKDLVGLLEQRGEGCLSNNFIGKPWLVFLEDFLLLVGLADTLIRWRRLILLR